MKLLFNSPFILSSLVLVSVPAIASEDATLFPVPELSGNLCTREVLTGDWGGFRQSLADKGIQLDVSLHQYYQGVTDGGRGRDSWEDSGSLDYRLKIDTGKAGWWEGGFIEIHGETYFGNSVSSNVGALMPVNTDNALREPNGEGTYLSHVVITQFLSEQFAVFFGKLDTTVGDANDFAHGTGDEKFQNIAFSFNPVTLMSAPYSTLGAGFFWLPNETTTISFSAYDLEGDLESSGFDTVFEDGSGYNVELQFVTDFGGKPGHQRFGFTYADGDFVSLNDPRILLPPLPVSVDDGTWNVYYNFDQYLRYDPDTGAGWGVFGRLGIADEETNPIPLFASVGIGGTGLFEGRENDRFGIGYYYLETSDELPGFLLSGEEHGVELFYDFEMTPFWRLAADLQIISPALKSADTATVFGLRSSLDF